MSETPPDAAGHRTRLRTRLIEGGADALQDYELIEYLLALAIPRRDTKPLAKALLREFGGIGPLLSADPQALLRVPGVGASAVAALRIVDVAALRLLRTQASDQPILSGWQALLDYLQADMAHIGIERVRVLHLKTCPPLIWLTLSRSEQTGMARSGGEPTDGLRLQEIQSCRCLCDPWLHALGHRRQQIAIGIRQCHIAKTMFVIDPQRCSIE